MEIDSLLADGLVCLSRLYGCKCIKGREGDSGEKKLIVLSHCRAIEY